MRLSLGMDEAEATHPAAEPAALPDALLLVDASTPVPLQPGEPMPEATASVFEEQPPAQAPVEVAADPVALADPRRVTVLLMGIDQRQGEEGQFRTDTMIVLSIDPVSRTGAMLSIPRDLWVSIPGGFSEQRINTANYIGDNPEVDYPGGGPALAMKTVEKVLGTPIQHYVLVNFDAFTTFIDSIGPIEICVQELIDDPKYPDGSYGYQPIRIEPGCQPMESERLLQYARTRATSGGDFDRAARQQEVILAVRDKILSAGGARALLGDALTLWESVSANVRTDLTLDELINLALIAQEVTLINNGTIGEGEVFAGLAPDGSEILIPIQSDILRKVSELFRPGSAAATAASATINPDDLPLAVREEAPILALLNGTNTGGRASALRDYLIGFNLDVEFVGNHTSTAVEETVIIGYGDHLDSAEYVAQVLAGINDGLTPRVEQNPGSHPNGDVVIIIGSDLVIPTSAP
ncbi:MAG: LCP family protein [Anaerolineae bacterium]|nr:LCP family protein [Anaerolineae bacterium]